MKTFTKILMVLIIILIENSVLAQDSIYCKGVMCITDTIVVKKRHQQAVELNVHISFPTTDTVILHWFRENVYTQGTTITIDSIHYNLYDAIQLFQPSNVGSFGLEYILEDSEGNQIMAGPPFMSFYSCDRVEDEVKLQNSRYIVNKRNLKVKFKWIEDDLELREIDYNTIIVNGETNVKVFPMITKKLEPGKYKLFLYYSVEDSLFKKTSDHAFSGLLLSNKIDLIVK